jgi:mono/diheme cytochrome c family protein
MKMTLSVITLLYFFIAGSLKHTGSSTLLYNTKTATEINQAEQSGGNQLYVKYCLQCHQTDGKGVRGMFPPLAGNGKIIGPSIDIIRIVLFGLEGPLTVNERDYDQTMPPQSYLTDKQIADIISYIRNSWGNQASNVTPADVGKIRKLGKPKN